jgi:PBP1b-binding outer membrane lipoprotein LpoB
MKKISYTFLFVFLSSCTSNTIFEKPKDLIPKDTMSLLIQEMMIASAAKNIKNIHLEKNINYMPFVYDTFKIDSVRFQNSNSYYVTKIDLYQDIFNDVKAKLEKQKEELVILKKQTDSIRKDSIKLLKKKSLFD